MTAMTRSAECNGSGTALRLTFDLGNTQWTLGLTTAPAQHPHIRTMPAGDLSALVKEIQLAKARFGLPLGTQNSRRRDRSMQSEVQKEGRR